MPNPTDDVALRLYPPVPINSRFCKKTTTLPIGGGADGRSPILVRAGMPVAYSVYHMHRREDLYGKDAWQYRPERWEDASLNDIGWGYLPFNGGPRVCLGSEFPLSPFLPIFSLFSLSIGQEISRQDLTHSNFCPVLAPLTSAKMKDLTHSIVYPMITFQTNSP